MARWHGNTTLPCWLVCPRGAARCPISCSAPQFTGGPAYRTYTSRLSTSTYR